MLTFNAGLITETNEGEFVFQYEEQNVKDHPKDCITFTMPVTSEPYTEKRLFPFFEIAGQIEMKSISTMTNKTLAADYFKDFLKNKYEICPGQSSQMIFISIYFPGFIF